MKITDHYSHHAFNKSVVIELPDYQYNHQPLDGIDDDRYIGRERIERQFLQYLKDGSPRGSYLVTGYRGMGKTSFVNKVIEQYRQYKEKPPGKKKVKKIDLSFSQKNLNKEDILKQILDSLIDYLETDDIIINMKRGASPGRLLRIFIWILSIVLLYSLFPVLSEIWQRRGGDSFFFSLRPFGTSALFTALGWITIAVSLLTLALVFSVRMFMFLWNFVFKRFVFKGSGFSLIEVLSEDIYSRLQELKVRSNAVLTEEDNLNSSHFLPNFPLTLFSRKSRNYPIMRGKDIENDLIKIIGKFKKTELVFVFDELDKVDAGIDWDESLRDSTDSSTAQSYNRSREQKETVVSILASLKFFMSQTKAKFVFIAGREMFDAALADIADRQNYLGSIFHHVIYVDSFLKDSPPLQNTGITQRVEEYLELILLGSYNPKLMTDYDSETNEDLFLRKYFFFLKENYLGKTLNMEEILKIIYSLQMFIIYITYRSNGSPKKMTRIIEEHIFRNDREFEEKYSFKDLLVKRVKEKERKDRKPSDLQLKLSYDVQYRNAYISYLYRPFLMNYSNYAKRLSDKILVAIPFMTDHIFKFHAFAFSRQNLELLPEVISPNRTHLVRNLIFDLISYFSENHIKHIETGLFEYRFNRKTSDELKFLSKVFEEESAAFNFSLDEMQSVKAYLQNKIEHLRTSHLGSRHDTTKEKTLYSLSFLESLMGDAYYFDKEYDLAILSYLDSIQTLRFEENAEGTFENRISVLRLLLKIGLMYELMKKYDMALGYFYDALQYYKEHFSTDGREYKYIKDLLKQIPAQLFFKTILSIVSLTEKKINNGITLGNLEELDQLVNAYFQPGRPTYFRTKEDDNNPRINLELAHYYTELGVLLFHKNMIPIRTRNNIPGAEEENTIIESNVSGPVPFNRQSSPTEKKPIIESKDLVFEIIFSNFSLEEMVEFKIKYPHKDYRPALVSLGEYKKALLSMLSSLEIEKISKKDDYFARHSFTSFPHISYHELEYTKLSVLLFYAARKIKNYKNVYVTNYLQICGNTFSHIGDSLFSITVKNIGNLEHLAAYARHYDLKGRILDCISKEFSAIGVIKLISEIKKTEDTSFAFSNFIQRERKDLLKFLDFVIVNQNETDSLKKLCELRPMKFWDDITYDYFEYLGGLNKMKADELLKPTFSETQFIVFVYYLSARFFSKSGLNHNFSHQVKKIFQVVRNNSNRSIMNTESLQNMKEVVIFFERTLLKLVLESTSRSSHSTDRPQMQKYKYYEGLNMLEKNEGNFSFHPKAFARYNYFNLSNAPEVKEAILYFALLKLKATEYPEIPFDAPPQQVQEKVSTDEKITPIIYTYINTQIPELQLINPNNVPSSQYSRLLEVDLHARINRIILKKIANKYKGISTWEDNLYFKLKRAPKEVTIATEVEASGINKELFGFLCELVASSIFLHVQQIKVYNIFQVNPLLNNTNLGLYHKRLGRWLKYYLILNSIDKVFYPKSKITYVDSKINALFGNTYSQISLDTTSQFQIALQLLHKAKQYHSNGLAFKRELENKVYLEGDYSDITYNFGLALERHKVNSGKIRDEIRKLEKELADSPLLKYESFTNSEEYPDDEYMPYGGSLK